jgi:hypothetical protein
VAAVSLFPVACLGAAVRQWRPWFLHGIIDPQAEPPLAHFIIQAGVIDATLALILGISSPEWGTVLFLRLVLAFLIQIASVGRLKRDVEIPSYNDTENHDHAPRSGRMPGSTGNA